MDFCAISCTPVWEFDDEFLRRGRNEDVGCGVSYVTSRASLSHLGKSTGVGGSLWLITASCFMQVSAAAGQRRRQHVLESS